MHLFARNGYTGTSLAEIAKRVGIKTPSIFAHFKGKEDLFLSIFAEISWQEVSHAEQVSKNIGDSSVEVKLRQIFEDTCRFYLQNEARTEFIKRTMLFPPDFLRDQIRDKFLHSESTLSHILEGIFLEGINQGVIRQTNVDELIHAYYCLIDGIILEMSYYEKESMKARCNSNWNHFWLGLTNHQKEQQQSLRID